MSDQPASLFQFISTAAPRYLLRMVILSGLLKKYLHGSGQAFLEIGPGRGDVSCFLAQHPAMRSGTIMDLSEESIAMVKSRLGENRAVQILRGGPDDLPEGSQFDYVVSCEVLEHIADDQDFLQAVATVTRVGGLWFISVPAYMRKWQRQDEFSGHVRRYEPAELAHKLDMAGFEIVQMIDYGFPLTSLMRPFRDRYYKPDRQTSQQEKTLDSGVKNRMLTDRSPWPMLILLSPFLLLQRWFGWLGMGDGLIVVARKK